ncbi:tetratricopeptide repeat protein [Brevundimonas guildfordensis]|uniref:Tetratricopeptide repeat protein n=1 Tax=Brevundimonas guildfordensis TaxID=2762241 RepID=A0ABR8R013_9CAUL|nr:tetratricopeptide repeat protein [Brevundimonas guildfordensis]MBD7941120.1 tetratricopeptide repeat protein [Brevundimonas guildfordensis]
MAGLKMFPRRWGPTRPLAIAAAAVLATMSASPARADWLRAESERFVVYSDGGANQLRQFTQELESFDRLLRIRLGVSLEAPTYRKLPVYLLGSRTAMLRVRPGAQDGLAGFYMATDEDIFGVARRDEEMHTLKHEYAHHFMMQNFSHAYPAWFIEGFAEYFATADFKRDEIHVGKYSQNRAYWLINGAWVSMEELLAERPGASVRHRETYYPLAWLLTHWFMSDTERRRTLGTYLAAVGDGADPVAAMRDATGLTTTELQRALRRYVRERMTYVVMKTSFDATNIVVTTLPKSADDLLLLNQRLKVGVPEEQRAATAQDVRRAAARHPDDPLALLALGHAELHFGDAAGAEAPLQRLIELDPDHVEGLQYLARTRMDAAAASDDRDAALRLKVEAQGYLSRAYVADDANYVTLLLIAENRADSPSYPNENDVAVLEQAFVLAPQLGVVRINLAQALLAHDRNIEAAGLLRPLVADPHAPSSTARALLQRAEGRSEADEDDVDDHDISVTPAPSDPAARE